MICFDDAYFFCEAVTLFKLGCDFSTFVRLFNPTFYPKYDRVDETHQRHSTEKSHRNLPTISLCVDFQSFDPFKQN